MIYYVKSDGGNGDGLSDATAWSYAKFNATEHGGNTILFKSGDVYKGGIQIRPGSDGSPTIIDAYGTGAMPDIDGFTNLTNWTLESPGIYSASIDVVRIDAVSVNGQPKGAGRYPKNEYAIFTSHVNNSSISGPSIGQIPFDPAGSEVVIRKDRYVLDRHPVNSRSGNTLNISAGSGENNGEYTPNDGNGYFIQNSLGCVTQENEWYYDAANNKLYFHFGSSQPSSKIIKVHSTEFLLYLNGLSYIDVKNISFRGGRTGVVSNAANNINFQNCEFREQAVYAVHGFASQDISVDNCTFQYALSLSVNFEYGNERIRVDDNIVEDTGSIEGAGGSNGATYSGIYVNGTNSLIRRNKVTNTGYNAIGFDGDGSTVANNFIDTFCKFKDDGGGIYTYFGLSAIIENNVILNGLGKFEGAAWHAAQPFGAAAGVYLDRGTEVHNATVRNNFVANCDWNGIIINSNQGNQIIDNICFNNRYQMLITNYQPRVRNSVIRGNKFISKLAYQKCLHIDTGLLNSEIDDNPSLYGEFSDNVYARPIQDDKVISIYRNFGEKQTQEFTLSEWKTAYPTLDVNSKKSFKSISNVDDFKVIINDSVTEDEVFELDQGYKDFDGQYYNNEITLEPLTGTVLLPASLNENIYYSHNGKKLISNGKLLIKPQ